MLKRTARDVLSILPYVVFSSECSDACAEDLFVYASLEECASIEPICFD